MSRPTGSQHAKDRLWRALRKEFGENFDPILQMAQIGMDASNDVNTRLQAFKEVSKYIQPQLKATEVTHQDGETRQRSRTEVAARLLSLVESAAEQERTEHQTH